MKQVINVPYTGKKMKLTTNTIIRRSFALKNHFSRHKIDVYEILKSLGHKPITCAFCGQYNSKFYLVTEIETGSIRIIEPDYTYGGTTDGLRFCHGNKNCSGKKFNPNSVNFVRLTRGFSTNEEALEFIHNRNTTPFYKENHQTEEDYKKSQKRDSLWFEERGLSPIDSYKKGAERRSLEGRIQKYGEEAGTFLFKDECAKRAITLENMFRIHGDLDIARKLVEDHRRRTSGDIENYIRRFGYVQGYLKFFQYCSKNAHVETKNDLVRYALTIVERNAYRRLDSFPLEQTLLQSSLIKNALIFFGISIENLCSEIKQISPEICSLSCEEMFKEIKERNSVFFGKLYYTTEGRILRSSYEINFYTMCATKDWKIEVDKNYPNSTLRYDFYFPEVNIYVEVAGFPKWDDYKEKLEQKQSLFHSWILWNEQDYRDALNQLEILHTVIRSYK